MNSLEDTHTMDSYAIKKGGATSFDLEGCPWVLMNAKKCVCKEMCIIGL